MAEYDELYLVKNPFFLGSYERAIKECENVVLEETDLVHLERRTLYLVRAYLSLSDWDKAQTALSKHLAAVKCSEEEKQKFGKIVGIFIEFVKTGVKSSSFIQL